MKDLLDNELNIGDNIAFLPRKLDSFNIQYGVITKLTDNDYAAYCKSISEPTYDELIRYKHQILKIQQKDC